jgi:Ser/Thr protein kinase RdoA (MazF antagonist)
MTDLKFPLEILANWEIGPIKTIQPQPPGENVAGNVFFIETESGARYVLKCKTVARTREQENVLMGKLASQGVPVALPLQARSGEPYLQTRDGFFDLTPHLPGRIYLDHYAPGAVERARLFGAAIARLHAALRSCGASMNVPDMDLPGDIARYSRELRPVWPAGQLPLDPILAALQAGLEAHYAALPKQLIHRDPHPGNMLFRDGKLTGWLDFEIMLRGPRLFDLGYCSTSLLIGGIDDPDKRQAWLSLLEALVTGYETVSLLQPVERQALKFVLWSIEVIFIAFFAKNGHLTGVTQNIQALTWLYQNLP